MSLRRCRGGCTRQRCPFKHPPIQEDEASLDSTPAVEPIFYADATAGVNIQLPVAEENFSRAPSVIERERNVYELLCVLPPNASAGDEAVDHASFALGSPRATGAVRVRRTYA